jgi:hypothetical protein
MGYEDVMPCSAKWKAVYQVDLENLGEMTATEDVEQLVQKVAFLRSESSVWTKTPEVWVYSGWRTGVLSKQKYS